MTNVLEVAEEVEHFIVEFYNPANHFLHSAVPVVCKATEAVREAIEVVARDYKEDVSRHRPAIKRPDGSGVVGMEAAISKAAIYAQLQQLQQQLARLDEDGRTPEQRTAVERTLPNPNPHVAAPPVVQFSGDTGPTPANEPPTNVAVPPPVPFNGPASQADIDAQLASHDQ